MKHFRKTEFACPCCGRNEMDPAFLEKLDRARDWAGVPFRITSAFRCPAHNAKVGGRPDSNHMDGQAVDIAWTDPGMLGRIIASLHRVGIISMAVDDDRHFIHCDTWGQYWFNVYRARS